MKPLVPAPVVGDLRGACVGPGLGACVGPGLGACTRVGVGPGFGACATVGVGGSMGEQLVHSKPNSRNPKKRHSPHVEGLLSGAS